MMKRLLGVFAIATLLMAAFVPPIHAQEVPTISFFVNVVGDNGEALGAVGRCRVITYVATPGQADATVYTTGSLVTASANPMAMDANGACVWYGGGSPTAYDVIVYIDSGAYEGFSVRVNNITRSGNKKINADRRMSGLQQKTIPYALNVSTQTSTVTIPAGAAVMGATIETVTAGTAGTQGIGGDMGSTVSFGYASPGVGQSFCNQGSTGAIGFTQCALTAPIQIGTSALALNYVTSNHGAGGYLSIFYRRAGQ